jgi:hypothetical protein
LNEVPRGGEGDDPTRPGVADLFDAVEEAEAPKVDAQSIADLFNEPDQPPTAAPGPAATERPPVVDAPAMFARADVDEPVGSGLLDDEAAPTGGVEGFTAGDSGSPLDELARPAAQQGWWWKVGFPSVLVALVLAVPVLLWIGKDALLETTDGQLVESVNDPAAPGYQALADPTPALLVVSVDEAGLPAGYTVLSQLGPDAGAAVVMPRNLVVTEESATGEPVDVGLVPAWEEGGMEAVQPRIEAMLDAQVDDAVTVSTAEWEALVAPVGSVTVEVTDPVVVDGPGGPAVRFDRGTVALGADEVGEFLTIRGVGESDLNVVARQQRFWEGWAAALSGRTDEPGIIPGEESSGLGAAVRSLARGDVEVVPLPVENFRVPGFDEAVTIQRPIESSIPNLVARYIPLPVGAPPGSRTTVAVLDGTGSLDNGLPAVPVLVAAGAEIRLFGNDDRFGQATTRLVAASEEQRAAAEALRAALGFGEVEVVGATAGGAQVTVVLGDDAIAGLESVGEGRASSGAPGPGPEPSTAGPSGG